MLSKSFSTWTIKAQLEALKTFGDEDLFEVVQDERFHIALRRCALLLIRDDLMFVFGTELPGLEVVKKNERMHIERPEDRFNECKAAVMKAMQKQPSQKPFRCSVRKQS